MARKLDITLANKTEVLGLSFNVVFIAVNTVFCYMGIE